MSILFHKHSVEMVQVTIIYLPLGCANNSLENSISSQRLKWKHLFLKGVEHASFERVKLQL